MNLPKIQDESGILHIPMALMTVLFFVTGLGLWGVLHHWKSLAQTQLRLDRCTGETALELKMKLQTIASANEQMKVLRVSEAAAVTPQATAAFQLAIEAEVLRQEKARADWSVNRMSWTAQSGCGGHGDSGFPLPDLSWTREPPDALGPQPLNLDELPKAFRIQLNHQPRASAAEVSSGNPYDRTSWHARWIPPQKFFGASLL
jgi:hypothetical protein